MNFWAITAFILTAITLPGSIELLLLTIGGIIPRKRASNFITNMEPTNEKLVVIVPAHNEENHIDKTLSSLTHAEGNFDIVVLADHCTDATVQKAKKWKVRVIERSGSSKQGKQYALKEAFETLLKDNYDVYAVVDADSTISPNFSPEILRMVEDEKAQAVQAFYGIELSKQMVSLPQARMLQLAYLAFNYFRPLARTNLGFSCGIVSNGFALSRKTLLSVPFRENSNFQDISYHIRLVSAKRKVIFNSRTKVYSEIKEHGKTTVAKLSKWEGRRIMLLFEMFPTIIKGIFKGNLLLIEPLLDLFLLPISFHALILLIILVIPICITQWYAVIGLIILMANILVILKVCRGNFKDLSLISYAPVYLFQKLKLTTKLLLKRP